jgi:transposase
MPNVPRKPRRWRRGILAWARRLKDAATMLRVQVIAHATAGRGAVEIVNALGCVRSHVYRTAAKFVVGGRAALLDQRSANGRRLADDNFDRQIDALVRASPEDHGYPRPTWTRELLILVAEQLTGVRVSLTVMGRVLHRIGARRGRPKPIVRCPLSPRHQRRRLRTIKQLIADLPADEVAVYEDEADVHLNPKIGIDWMARGQQKLVVTPGNNKKAYLAGALDARDGTVLWVGAEKKNSALFVAMLDRLHAHYRTAKYIHVVLDNYGIHSSHETRRALARLPRIRLHFLPSYSPDHNRIERFWQDLHANVTRNHRHTTIEALCAAVAAWLNAASPWPSTMRCPALSRS